MALAATKVGSAYIELTAKTDKYTRQMAEADAQAKKTGAAITGSFRKMDADIAGITGGIDKMKAGLIALGGALVFNEMNKLSDTFSLMRSRIRLVTKEGEDLFAIEDKLAKQAITNRSDLQSTIDLYTRLRQTRSDLSDEATRDLVDKWSKSLIISASSAQEAASSTQQFSQAMAAGVLAGQELRSVIQGNSAFAVYLAEALGVTTGQLKQMGEEGKLTTDVIFEGLQRVGDHIEKDFSKKAMTIGQAMTNIETATLRLVGSIDQATGGSQGLAGMINMLAQAIETFTMFVRGSSPAIEKMKAQTDLLAAAIKATDEQVAKGGLKDLGDDAKEALQPLTDVEQKIADINKRLEESGARARFNAISRIEGGMIMQLAEIGRLEDELNKLKTPQVGRGGDAGFTVGSRSEIAATQKALDDARRTYGDALIRLEQLEKTPDAAFKPAVNREALDVMKTQLALELARARGNEKEAARLEDVLMTEKLITEYKQKGLTTEEAAAKAAGHVVALRRAMNSTAEKERQRAEDEATLRFQLAIAEAESDKTRVADLETQLEINRRSIELEEQGLSIDMARARATDEVNKIRAATNAATEKELAAARDLRDLEYQIALAAADKDEKKERALQRELDIRRQIKELTDLGYDGEQARVIATQRVDSLISDDPTAWLGFEDGVAAATKRGLMNAIETGDWGDAFGEILTDVTRDALSRALDVLWEALAQIDWGGQGQGWAGFFNMVGGSFAGNKASGGDVSAGRMYRVGELGSEWFVPKVDGQIIPNNAGKTLGAPMQISVGGAQVIIQGDASERTAAMIAESLTAYTRALPGMIDARVTDRQKRGAY